MSARDFYPLSLFYCVSHSRARSLTHTLCVWSQAEGTHTPAMFEEVVRELGCRGFPKGVFVDGTFGRGGHTRKILAALGPGAEVSIEQ